MSSFAEKLRATSKEGEERNNPFTDDELKSLKCKCEDRAYQGFYYADVRLSIKIKRFTLQSMVDQQKNQLDMISNILMKQLGLKVVLHENPNIQTMKNPCKDFDTATAWFHLSWEAESE